MQTTTEAHIADRALSGVAWRLREIADYLDAVRAEGPDALAAADGVAREVEAIFAVCDLG